MSKVKFENHWVSARKDLLHFVEEHVDKDVLKKIGEDPARWIEELNIISFLLSRENLVAGSGIDVPPLDDLEFMNLGSNVYINRGSNSRGRGLWTSEEKEAPKLENDDIIIIPQTVWTHYRMGFNANLKVNSQFNDKINIEDFLPENFEPKSEVVKEDKRPILTFNLQVDSETMAVYAKGCCINCSYLYSPPSYRLTNLIQVNRISSKKEMNRTLELAEKNVNVPIVIGYYESKAEEFLFLQKVEGETPDKFLETHRNEIIDQDAEMLAVLCLLGYRKVGFECFDDKIFDGKNLYLIDVDELVDLYFPSKPEQFRETLLDTFDKTKLRQFRKEQKGLFKKMLKDAIYRYKESLTPRLEDQIRYIEKFHNRVGWRNPTEKQIKSYTHFPKLYTTYDSYMCMMMEE